MQCFDWNAVNVGDDCYIDGYLQFHTFENMILKVKRTHIHDRCVVNLGATVMGGAVIEPDSILSPLSLVLKEMKLPTGAYEGSPAEPVSGFTPLRGAPGGNGVNKNEAAYSTSTPRGVDSTVWLKTAAIILASIGHIGFYLINDDLWWSVFGRFAAPVFFFLMGYARSRRVPRSWIALGLMLTLLESSNNNWTWVSPNILLSFALIRIARPYAKNLVERYGWAAFFLIAASLVAVQPLAAYLFDYGAEGWLWALFGLFQRIYVDGRAAIDVDGTAKNSAPHLRWMTKSWGAMRPLACLIAAVVYVWQEQKEFAFPQVPFTVFVIGLGLMSVWLYFFRRGPSRIHPPEFVAVPLRFISRHTLAIYAFLLAGFELLVKLVPSLAP